MGKSRKTEQKVTIDKDIKKMAQENYGVAQQVAALGYQPNRGVTIAGFTPQQQAAMEMNNQGAAAFGFSGLPSPMEGMPAMQTDAQGIRGYSTAPSYDDMMSRFPPEYLAAIEKIFSGLRGNANVGSDITPPSQGSTQPESLASRLRRK